MRTMDLNAFRNELAREILSTEDMEVLKKMKKYFTRISKTEDDSAAMAAEKEDLTPYTMEEINSWIDESEAEEEAGIPGIPWEEARDELLKTLPWLCK